MEPALKVGLAPACERAETHSLCQFIGKCDRISRQETISNIYKSNSTRARPPAFYQGPHSSFIVRIHMSWNAPTYQSKLSLFFFAFFPTFATPPYLIFVIRSDICAYMRVPSRSDATLFTSPMESIWRSCSGNPNARLSDASGILYHSRGAPFSSRSLSITI